MFDTCQFREMFVLTVLSVIKNDVFENILAFEIDDSFVDLLFNPRQLSIDTFDISDEVLVDDYNLLHDPTFHIDQILLKLLDQYLSMFHQLLPYVSLTLLFLCSDIYEIITDLIN